MMILFYSLHASKQTPLIYRALVELPHTIRALSNHHDASLSLTFQYLNA